MSRLHTALRLALFLAAFAPIVVTLAACNTTAGAGKDISATGHAITDTADKDKPNGP